MNFGSNKSGSHTTSFINRVFPVSSWFSRLVRTKRSSFSDRNTLPVAYSMDEDDAYWRISFSKEKFQQGRRSTGGINPLWFEDDEFEFELPVSSFKSLDLGGTDVPSTRGDKEYPKFSDMVSDVKRTKEKQRIPSQVQNVQSWSRLRHGRRQFDDAKVRLSNLGEMEQPPHVWEAASSTSRKPTQISDFHLTSTIKEIKTKPDCPNAFQKTRNKSLAVKVYSPRSECKIRAIKEMKRARIKYKKNDRNVDVMERKTTFDSLAVVKSSYDPQKDFRDSMVEMIREKGIRRSEDLEELLACYLTLNCDEYHDLIVKVFRQVWFEVSESQTF